MKIMDKKTKKNAAERTANKTSTVPISWRIPAILLECLEILARSESLDASDEFKIAVRDRLRKYNLWPPPKEIQEKYGMTIEDLGTINN